MKAWMVVGLLALGLPATAGAQAPADVVEYYHLDAVGSVRAVTSQSGAVVRTHDYRPFGEGENPTAGTDPTRFTGKERDAESGLDYFGARYYASRSGRFTTVDPGHVNGNIFDPQSWNAYAYARNNPLKYVDPTGTTYEICGYNESGGIGSCGSVSDEYFGSLSRTASGHGMRLFGGTIWMGDTAVGSYRQTSVDPTFYSVLGEIGRRGEAGVNAALIVSAPNFALAAGASLGSLIAGNEIVSIGGKAGFDLLANRALNQGIGAAQRALLRRLFTEGRLPEGLSRRALELYREIARRAITEGKDAGVQVERLKLIEQVLKQLR